MPFQAGYARGVTFELSTGSTASVLQVTGSSWAEAVDALDVTHTGTGGIQALLAGVLRGDGNVKAKWNSDAIASNSPPGIYAGAKGVIRKFLSGSNAFVIPVLIVKVNYQSAVEGTVEYNFDTKLDYIVGAAMTPYAYP